MTRHDQARRAAPSYSRRRRFPMGKAAAATQDLAIDKPPGLNGPAGVSTRCRSSAANAACGRRFRPFAALQQRSRHDTTVRAHAMEILIMNARTTFVAIATALAALTTLPGCAVSRGQSSVGEYIDDASITTAVKAKFVESKSVDATSIKVETLNGEVMLSGFAKSGTERSEAENLARGVHGVKAVKNQVVVRS
jgi:hypothetical protein